MPGLGDDIQTIKAGVMEIGDIFVINKADLAGADLRYVELQSALGLSPQQEGWQAPIIKTVATEGEGVDELVATIHAHHDYLVKSGEIQRNRERRCGAQLEAIVEQSFVRKLFVQPEERALFESLVREVHARRLDPYTAAERLILRLVKSGATDRPSPDSA
jgi:LAO/AO transport system kinase